MNKRFFVAYDSVSRSTNTQPKLELVRLLQDTKSTETNKQNKVKTPKELQTSCRLPTGSLQTQSGGNAASHLLITPFLLLFISVWGGREGRLVVHGTREIPRISHARRHSLPLPPSAASPPLIRSQNLQTRQRGRRRSEGDAAALATTYAHTCAGNKHRA